MRSRRVLGPDHPPFSQPPTSRVRVRSALEPEQSTLLAHRRVGTPDRGAEAMEMPLDECSQT